MSAHGRDRPRTRRVGILAVTASVLLVALTAAVAFDLPLLVSLDHRIGSAALSLTRGHPSALSLWTGDASVEQPDVFRVLLLAGVVGLLVTRRWWYAGWLASVLVLSTALAGVVKEPLARPRPTWSDPVATAAGYSYPSGHATAAWVFATASVLLALALLAPSRARTTVVTLAVVAATLVSLDRVFLGVHHPSDVAAGALLGCLLAVLPWLVLCGVARTRSRRSC